MKEVEFEEFALALFNYQYTNNQIYKAYVDLLKISPSSVKSIKQIPFLPIDFFKKHEIKTGSWSSEIVFESSGTTGKDTSKHHLDDSPFYLEVAGSTFSRFYGDIDEHTFIALLPSYLERNNSSLVFMVNHFINSSKSSYSGFYLKDYEELFQHLQLLKKKKLKTIIIGVTFALLDFAEMFQEDFSEMIFMETGGMKGRRRELTQVEVHKVLNESFSAEKVHTEYGMTELLSQAYAKGEGLLSGPPWYRVLIRDLNDPFDLQSKRKTGGINIIDLANVHSCAFIETQDVGELRNEKEFKILGRMDNSEMRGCSLLIQ